MLYKIKFGVFRMKVRICESFYIFLSVQLDFAPFLHESAAFTKTIS